MTGPHRQHWTWHNVMRVRKIIDSGLVTQPLIAKVLGVSTANLTRWRREHWKFYIAWRDALINARDEALDYLASGELTADQRKFCRKLVDQCEAELKARFRTSIQRRLTVADGDRAFKRKELAR